MTFKTLSDNIFQFMQDIFKNVSKETVVGSLGSKTSTWNEKKDISSRKNIIRLVQSSVELVKKKKKRKL